MTDNLLSNYQHVIDQFTLITGSGGAFELTVNDELIFSKKALNRHAKPGEILELFEEMVGSEVTPYPQ